jgi:effector-binding domain-containing protein
MPRADYAPASLEIRETMPSRLFSLIAAVVLTSLASVSFSPTCRADQASQAAAPAASSATAPASQQTPTATGQRPSAQAPATGPSTPSPAPPAASPAPSETKEGAGSTGETVDLAARPFAYIEGKAGRDEIYSSILGSLGLVKRDMDKAGIKPGGRPLAVFIESDDTGFRYRAGYPLEAAPEGKTSLSEAVKIGQTPSGKAMKFEHLGAYADIDATYDAITAYLDEKGIDAQDSFVEEYVNDVKDADDPNLQVNIYVLLK